MGAEQWVSGIQHIGIPTSDIEMTIGFYEKLGFVVEHRKVIPSSGVKVAFLGLKNLVLETYEEGGNGIAGAINHFALDCTNIKSAYAWAHDNGYKILSEGVEELPFWEKGVAFFIIEGPNKERIEFCERKK
ncbi:MAG: VOC family protein [Clostridia bacterium]|nr:VOC family protein [Clostridia bacterium]NCC42086.1 VOC family protein [Clostridia bacterium]